MNNKYTVIDLFSGCGGFGQGFLKTGFEIIAANEIWEPAVKSYRYNHESVNIVEGDITLSEKKQELYDLIAGKKVNVIIGGPPCQGYSIAGNRNPDDPRGQLYLDFIEIINHVKPDVFIMENVKGLLHMKHVNSDLKNNDIKDFKENCEKLQRFKDLKRYSAQRELDGEEEKEFLDLKSNQKILKRNIDANLIPLIDKIMAKFEEINYKVSWEVLNSADYGVPQTRQRIIFIGTRHDKLKITFPTKTHSRYDDSSSKKKLKRWINVKEILEKYEKLPESNQSNHIFTKHSEKFIKKINCTKIGENVYKNYSDAWWRLIPNKPARTVKENHGGVFIHYNDDRACTPRELAALQSFDDEFIFQGTKSAILKQIGNAVPPLMAKAIAEQVKKSLDTLVIQ